MIFAVITRVPDPEKEGGNLYNPIIYKQNGGINITAMRANPNAEVFELGEILILAEEGGREVAGIQRKPSKWGVDVEYFDEINEAIARAKKVIEIKQSKY